MANEETAVVAIKVNSNIPIIIIKGTQKYSEQWGGLNAPQCASFHRRSNSFDEIMTTLNYAFISPEGLQIWMKK